MSLQEENYIFTMDFIVGEMRALVEGALLLCELDLPALSQLSTRKSVLEATQTINVVVSTLGMLRDHIRKLQQGYIQMAESWDARDAAQADNPVDACKIPPPSPAEN